MVCGGEHGHFFSLYYKDTLMLLKRYALLYTTSDFCKIRTLIIVIFFLVIFYTKFQKYCVILINKAENDKIKLDRQLICLIQHSGMKTTFQTKIMKKNIFRILLQRFTFFFIHELLLKVRDEQNVLVSLVNLYKFISLCLHAILYLPSYSRSPQFKLFIVQFLHICMISEVKVF